SVMIHNRVPASLAVIGCVLLVAATRPAAAQFLWAETSTTPKPTFRLTFGEAAGESTPASLLERIQKARTWTADGKTLDLKPGDGLLLAALPTGVRSAGVEQTWGVLDRRPQGRGLFLLRYYAKAAQNATAAASSLKLPVEIFVGRAGAVWVATVRHNDLPVAGAEVWVARPGIST